MSKKKGFGKFLLGASVGVGIGMLFAPKKGDELRKDLKLKLEELLNKAKEVDVKEVSKKFQDKVEEVKKELEDLDKEKVLKVAKEKSEQLKEKCEELLALAKEKGTPVLQSVAKDVRNKSIAVTKEVLKKLESKENN